MTLPATITTGRVTGRFLVGVMDRDDDIDEEPDVLPAGGTVTFTASIPYLPSSEGEPTTIVTSSVRGILDGEGYLCTPSSANPKMPSYRGVRLIATDNELLPVQNWTWSVAYSLTNPDGTSLAGVIPGHQIAILTGSVQDLTLAIRVPAAPPVGTAQQEALVIRAVQAAEDAAASALAAAEAAEPAPGTDTVTSDKITDATTLGRTLLTSASAPDARTAIGAGTSSLALGTTSTTAKAGNYVPAWDDVTSKPTTFTPAVHTHTSGQITDFTEAAQDAVAAMLAAGTGVTLNYNDAGNSLTITSTAGQTLDAEAVRDAIGVALIGAGNISVVVNDAADTITITTTATVNSTDATLLARANHTGTQAISTVTNLQTSLDGKAATSHTHTTANVTGLDTALAARPLKTNTPFVTRWNGTAWEYASLAAAQTAGLDTTQIIMFIGHPDGTMPAWARDADIASVG